MIPPQLSPQCGLTYLYTLNHHRSHRLFKYTSVILTIKSNITIAQFFNQSILITPHPLKIPWCMRARTASSLTRARRRAPCKTPLLLGGIWICSDALRALQSWWCPWASPARACTGCALEHPNYLHQLLAGVSHTAQLSHRKVSWFVCSHSDTAKMETFAP